MPRYVMDVFGGNRLLVSRAFDGSDDADAVAKANAMFLSDAASGPEITGYRLRNPVPGADRIFHREYNDNATRATRASFNNLHAAIA